MWRPYRFTPSWTRRQWIHWAINRWPNESVTKFKQMKITQLIAIYHNTN